MREFVLPFDIFNGGGAYMGGVMHLQRDMLREEEKKGDQKGPSQVSYPLLQYTTWHKNKTVWVPAKPVRFQTLGPHQVNNQPKKKS